MVEEREIENITEDEAALYDRQIRLWGLDAQKRLHAANVLLIGMSGLGAEVAKNIALSGIKSLTLLDDNEVTEEDAGSTFLVSREDVGKNRATSSLENVQKLNPMVKVSAYTESVDAKADEYFEQFHVICATCCSEETLLRLNRITHRSNILFFAGQVFGFYGFAFTDLNDQHEYAEEVVVKKKPEEGNEDGEPSEKKKKAENETQTVKKTMAFTRLEQALNVDWEKDTNKKILKRLSHVYPMTQVFLRFREKEKRWPAAKTATEDKTTLTNLQLEVLEKMNLAPEKLGEEFVNYSIAELSAACAVVGGLMAQEIIKAVSQKDAPLNNFFLFDGREGCGIVEHLGY
ncbi:SUMO-activating enzyme subunit 1-like [Lineus longissimus]|uniref:SUMO-activating enzyme subunit 1-like n=1 Tax=Lineus longissimus TaxID=88925 RepID=UPI002B4DA963